MQSVSVGYEMSKGENSLVITYTAWTPSGYALIDLTHTMAAGLEPEDHRRR